MPNSLTMLLLQYTSTSNSGCSNPFSRRGGLLLSFVFLCQKNTPNTASSFSHSFSQNAHVHRKLFKTEQGLLDNLWTHETNWFSKVFGICKLFARFKIHTMKKKNAVKTHRWLKEIQIKSKITVSITS